MVIFSVFCRTDVTFKTDFQKKKKKKKKKERKKERKEKIEKKKPLLNLSGHVDNR